MLLANMYDRVYGDKQSFNANAGERIHTTYQLGFDDDGKRCLKPKGRVDVYNEIQSHAASVDIHVILDRFNNGDLSVLDNGRGYYLDLTQFPKTYAEMVQRMADAEAYFNSLPVEERKKYNFSLEEFLVAGGLSPEPEPEPDPAPDPGSKVTDPIKEV